MTTQPKLTRRQFLATFAAAAAGALVSGVVKVEAEPAEWDDISAKPLGPQYLLEDNFDGDPVGGVRTVMDWDAREDVRGIDLKLAVIMRPGLTTYYYNDGTGWRWRFKREMALYPTYSTDVVPITFEPWEPEPWEPDTQ